MFRILIFLFLSLKTWAYVNITPLTFDKRIDGEGGYKEYTLSNSSKNITKYRIYIEKNNEKYDMSDWVEFFPKTLTLKPGESKKIKVLITAPNDSREGEYTTNLCIKEVEVPLKNKELNILTNLKIELAGYVGDLKPKIEITNIYREDKSLKISFKNAGEIRQYFEIYCLDSKEKELVYLDRVRLFSKEEKEVKLLVEKIKGKLIILDQEGNNVLEKKIRRFK